MPERGIYRTPTVKGIATVTNCPIYLDSDDNTLKCIPAGSGTTEVVIPFATSTSGAKFAAGTGTLVSGTVAIATGLTSVLSFSASLQGTGASSSGVTEVAELVVSSITTGSVTVVGSYNAATGVRIASVSGTSAFYWIAVGQ